MLGQHRVWHGLPVPSMALCARQQGHALRQKARRHPCPSGHSEAAITRSVAHAVTVVGIGARRADGGAAETASFRAELLFQLCQALLALHACMQGARGENLVKVDYSTVQCVQASPRLEHEPALEPYVLALISKMTGCLTSLHERVHLIHPAAAERRVLQPARCGSHPVPQQLLLLLLAERMRNQGLMTGLQRMAAMLQLRWAPLLILRCQRGCTLPRQASKSCTLATLQPLHSRSVGSGACLCGMRG